MAEKELSVEELLEKLDSIRRILLTQTDIPIANQDIQAIDQTKAMIQRPQRRIQSEPGGIKPGQYMHEWIEEDAVEFDLPTEEIIGALCRDNELLKDKLDEAQQPRTVGREFVEKWRDKIKDDYEYVWRKSPVLEERLKEYLVEMLKELNIRVED